MPIHINLLSEAQAIEDQRRRDPVKRVVLAGAIIVVLIFVWSSSLMLTTMSIKGETARLESNLSSRTNEYHQTLENQKRLIDDMQKLDALQHLASARFLNGTILDAIQKATVDNVQLVRLKLDQTYTVTEGKTNGTSITPGAATERIVLSLNARDTSPTPGDGVPKLQQALTVAPYFQEKLNQSGGFRLTALGSPQTDTDGKLSLLFTLEGRYPDRTR